MAAANAKTAEAVAKLPDDKELADAAGKLKARAEQLAAEVTKLMQAVAEGPTAVKTTSEGAHGRGSGVGDGHRQFRSLELRVAELDAQAKTADVQTLRR